MNTRIKKHHLEYLNHLLDTKNAKETLHMINNTKAQNTAKNYILDISRHLKEEKNMKHNDFHVNINELKSSLKEEDIIILQAIEEYQQKNAYECCNIIKDYKKGKLLSITGIMELDRKLIDIKVIPDWLAEFTVSPQAYQEIRDANDKRRDQKTLHTEKKQVNMTANSLIDKTKQCLIGAINKIEENAADNIICANECHSLVACLCIITGRRPKELYQEGGFVCQPHPTSNEYLLQAKNFAKKAPQQGQDYEDIPVLVSSTLVLKALTYIHQYITQPLINNGTSNTNDFNKKHNKRIRDIFDDDYYTASKTRALYTVLCFKKRKTIHFFPNCEDLHLYAKQALRHEGEPDTTTHYLYMNIND